MRILIFAPYGLNTPHVETELELAQRHMDAGDTVFMVGCSAEMLACDANMEHALNACLICEDKRMFGQGLLSQAPTRLPLLKLNVADRQALAHLKTSFADLQDLRDLNVDGFDIGLGVLSSAVSATRDPNLDVREHADLLSRLTLTSFAVYLSMLNHLQETGAERIYLFNGRLAPMRAALRASQKLGIPFAIHERGANLSRFKLYTEGLPHDIAYMNREVRRAWERATDTKAREELAHTYFAQRAKGQVQSWHSFVTGQTAGQMPQDWDFTLHNIVMYLSSDDEFVAISDAWKNRIYENQLAGVLQVFADVADKKAVRVTVRMHPNSARMKGNLEQQLRARAPSNVHIEPPLSPVSTYALLNAADVALCFGSTVGVEALYWGRPSVVAGPSFYGDLGGVLLPATHQEVMSLILSKLEPQDRTPALMYGHYLQTFGEPFQYFEPSNVSQGTFKGQVLEARRSSHWVQTLSHTKGLRRGAKVASRLLRKTQQQLLRRGIPTGMPRVPRP